MQYGAQMTNPENLNLWLHQAEDKHPVRIQIIRCGILATNAFAGLSLGIWILDSI